MSWNRKGMLVCLIAVICLAAVLAGKAFFSDTGEQINYAAEEELIAAVTGGAVETVLTQKIPVNREEKKKSGTGKKRQAEKSAVPQKTPLTVSSAGKQEKSKEKKKKVKKPEKKKEKEKEPESEGNPAPIAGTPIPTGQAEEKSVIALEIQCLAIMKRQDLWRDGLEDVIPAQGIFYQGETEISEGESVYDVLKRVCKENGLLLDAEYTPLYGSYYIKGIGNLYEFDCGNESGWKYKVNDSIAGVGCSEYLVKNGDRVVFFFDDEI